VHEIYLPVQSSTWRFDADAVASYTITVTCDDGKTGGTATRTSIVGLTPNVAPSITNIPGRSFHAGAIIYRCTRTFPLAVEAYTCLVSISGQSCKPRHHLYAALRPRDGFFHLHQKHMKDTYNLYFQLIPRSVPHQCTRLIAIFYPNTAASITNMPCLYNSSSPI